MGRDVIILDTTLREQAPGYAMTTDEKVRLARQLEALGVDVIEAGFPGTSEGDGRGVQAVAEALRGPVVAALARCRTRDIDLAGEALRPAVRRRVHVFIGTSDERLERKLRLSREQCLERIRDAVRRASRYTDDVEFSADDATRTDLEYLCRVVEAAIAAGATTIGLPDTVGYALPIEYGAMFRAVRERVPNAHRAVFSAHCHDDLGLAMVNSLAAIDEGAGQVECTVSGIGERAGHAALEEIVARGHVRVNARELYRTRQLLADVSGVQAQPDPVGMAHTAVRTHAALVLDDGSGRHALERRYHELGYELDETALGRLYEQFVSLAQGKRELLDEDLLALLHGRFHDAPETYRLTQLAVTCGTVSASADVELAGPSEGPGAATATGNGPIAAAFAAIATVVGRQVDVLNLSVQSVTPGRDSLGQVVVQARIDGKTVSGHGASTDVVEASARALVHALNKVAHADDLESQSLNASYYWGV